MVRKLLGAFRVRFRPAAALVGLLTAAAAAASAPAGAASQEPSEPGAQRQERSENLEELAATATRAVVLIDTRTSSTSRQGSGFLVDANGRILTNYHVIRDARSVRVKLASGDVYDQIAILATDDRRDIAVLQIPGFDLPYLSLGNSDSLRIGAPVVLIGSPLGFENTVTTGIVSGRRQEPQGYQLVQISAPASQGSSGGPVLDRNGNVMGIAVSQMRAGQNINFALPINYARGMLAHVNGEPVAVLRPTSTAAEETPAPMSVAANAVNRGLTFELTGFGGYSLETEVKIGEDRSRRTRVTYRVIETVGGGEPRIERYLESETTRRMEPFGTHQTLRRERTRTIVHVDGLRPVSTRGEVSTWTGEGWRRSEYDLRFEGYRVRGLISDTTGRAEELDRELPQGIVLRELRDLAFATLAADSLMGRSVEFATFDPLTGDVMNDRYDVLEAAEVRVGGRTYPALRVNVASDLSNVTAYFRTDRPRILLRQESETGEDTEEVTRIEVFPGRGR